jgi:hypothetical protein
MKIFGYDHIIGNPVKRQKIKDTIRFWFMCFVSAFACIGFGNTLYFVWRLFHG